MKFRSVLVGACVFTAATISLAQTQTGGGATAAGTATAAAAGDLAEGEVRKIDKENKKITLKHGEIKNLEMPGMTMVFGVKDPAMLDVVKQGDKVKFKAEKIGGAFVVTDIRSDK
jgi:Cu/Ag efflux protein CusF